MTSEQANHSERRALSTHILSASVVMIGVSTTLIGLVKVAKPQMGATRVDEYAGIMAVLFFLSALASYSSIRFGAYADLSRMCDFIADQIFVVALIGISAIAIFFAYEVI
jgi:hypothetical protein